MAVYAAGSSAMLDAAYADLIEWVPALTFPYSAVTYSKMRTDPQIASIIAAYSLPIRRATWSLDQGPASTAVTKFVAENLGIPVGGDTTIDADVPPTIRWGDFIRVALLHLVYGCMPFEKIYDTSTGQARLAHVVERMPYTISELDVDLATNELVSARQNTLQGSSPDLTRNRLVWFANDREGSAWQGRSLLRPAYGPWLIKHEMWRLNATSLRRTGMGIPEVTAPPGATPQQILDGARLAQTYRVGETAGVGLPDGFTLRLVGITGTVPDPMNFIEYLDRQMTRAALTSFLDLGTSPNGSRALGDSFVDLFMLSLQATGDHMAEVINGDLVRDLVDLNFGENEPAPIVTIGDVGSRQELTAEALGILARFSIIEPDEQLEQYVRSAWRLPPRTTPRLAPLAPVEAPAKVTAAAQRVQRAIRAASMPPLRRALTPIEAAAQTDFQQVQASWSTAVEVLVAAWAAKVEPTMRKQLVDQVKAAVAAGDFTALQKLTVDVPAAAALIKDHMVAMADDAADQMSDEAAAQGVTATGAPDTSKLSDLASVIAALMAAGLTASATRAAIQSWAPDASATVVSDAVNDALVALTDAGPTANLGAALSVAQNDGRVAVMNAAEAQGDTAEYYASEVLDNNTCEPCADIDGHQFDNLTDAETAYASGGYTGCDGGLRCRGIIVANYNTAAAADSLDEAA